MRRLLAVAALAATLLVPAVAEAKRVRVFATGPKFDLSWVDTREHYRAKLLALMDAAQRGPGTPLVQDGADDVASHRLGPTDPARPVETARDLVALPEDVGLMAAFAGQRGETARRASNLDNAIAGLLVTYAPVAGHYAARYPELTGRPSPPTRLLALAMTDTFARVAVETFAELADRYDVWLEAGVNMAREWRIVCVSKASMPQLPGGARCEREDPAAVLALRAPDEPARTYAYEATVPEPVNMALVFDPDGRLVSRQVKAYLTPNELPGRLDLRPGEVSGLHAVATPVGRLGFVTSKDAWMPDVTTKLDQDRVEILVQPEFFVENTVRTTGPWNPDVLKLSGYADILRHPSMQALVLPEMTGNVYDFPADAQHAIALKPRSVRHAPVGAFVGQPPAPGLAVVSPWVVPDPLSEVEPFDARRKRLGEAGEAMLPGGPPCPDPRKPGPCAGGMTEGTIFADVQVGVQRRLRRQPVRRAPRPFTRSKPLAPSRRAQRNVALAGRDGRLVAAFEEHRRGRDVVLVARSGDDGAHWSRPVVASRRDADQWWPSVALGPGGDVWLAWQERSGETWRAYVARSRDGGRRFGAPMALAGAPGAAPAHQWRPAIAATGAGRAVAAWIDERERFTVDDLPQAGLWTARIDGATVGEAQRLDSREDVAQHAQTLDHAWAPSIAARGERVLVTWTDFRTYDWRAYVRESPDGGATWGPERQVRGGEGKAEGFDDRPQPALPEGGAPLVALTANTEHDDDGRVPHAMYDTVVATPGEAPVAVDGHGGAQTSTFAPAIVALPDGGALVAWQDHARGPGDIRAARVSGGAVGKALRVDDSGNAGWNQWRPALAATARSVVAAWEDERDGPAQIYLARARTQRLR